MTKNIISWAYVAAGFIAITWPVLLLAGLQLLCELTARAIDWCAEDRAWARWFVTRGERFATKRGVRL